MNRAQWVLMTTFAATFYGVGNIWMTQFGWRLWTLRRPQVTLAHITTPGGQ